LFIKIFLMKDEKKITIPEEQMAQLKERISLADKFLMVKQF
jgi:hypothetical protein